MLSENAKKALKVAMPQRREGQTDGEEVSEIVESSALMQEAADAISALGAPTPVTGVDGTGSNAASKADVDARLTAIHAKMDEIIAAIKS